MIFQHIDSNNFYKIFKKFESFLQFALFHFETFTNGSVAISWFSEISAADVLILKFLKNILILFSHFVIILTNGNRKVRTSRGLRGHLSLFIHQITKLRFLSKKKWIQVRKFAFVVVKNQWNISSKFKIEPPPLSLHSHIKFFLVMCIYFLLIIIEFFENSSVLSEDPKGNFLEFFNCGWK